MKKSDLITLIRECVKEVIAENKPVKSTDPTPKAGEAQKTEAKVDANILNKSGKAIKGKASDAEMKAAVAKANANTKNVAAYQPSKEKYTMIKGVPHKTVNGKLVPLTKK